MNIIAKVIESKGKVFLEGVSGALKDIKDVREIMEGESIIINGDGSVLLYVHHLGREVLIKESMLITPENIDIYLIMNEGTAEGQEELVSELKLKTKFDVRTGDEINITVDIEKNQPKTSSAKVSTDFTDEVVKNKVVDFKGGPEFSENGKNPSAGSNAGGNSGNQSIPRENVFEENINEPVTPTPITPTTPTIIPPVTPSPSEKEDNSGSGNNGGNSGSGFEGGNSGSGFEGGNSGSGSEGGNSGSGNNGGNSGSGSEGGSSGSGSEGGNSGSGSEGGNSGSGSEGGSSGSGSEGGNSGSGSEGGNSGSGSEGKATVTYTIGIYKDGIEQSSLKEGEFFNLKVKVDEVDSKERIVNIKDSLENTYSIKILPNSLIGDIIINTTDIRIDDNLIQGNSNISYTITSVSGNSNSETKFTSKTISFGDNNSEVKLIVENNTSLVDETSEDLIFKASLKDNNGVIINASEDLTVFLTIGSDVYEGTILAGTDFVEIEIDKEFLKDLNVEETSFDISVSENNFENLIVPSKTNDIRIDLEPSVEYKIDFFVGAWESDFKAEEGDNVELYVYSEPDTKDRIVTVTDSLGNEYKVSILAGDNYGSLDIGSLRDSDNFVQGNQTISFEIKSIEGETHKKSNFIGKELLIFDGHSEVFLNIDNNISLVNIDSNNLKFTVSLKDEGGLTNTNKDLEVYLTNGSTVYKGVILAGTNSVDIEIDKGFLKSLNTNETSFTISVSENDFEKLVVPTKTDMIELDLNPVKYEIELLNSEDAVISSLKEGESFRISVITDKIDVNDREVYVTDSTGENEYKVIIPAGALFGISEIIYATDLRVDDAHIQGNEAIGFSINNVVGHSHKSSKFIDTEIVLGDNSSKVFVEVNQNYTFMDNDSEDDFIIEFTFKDEEGRDVFTKQGGAIILTDSFGNDAGGSGFSPGQSKISISIPKVYFRGLETGGEGNVFEKSYSFYIVNNTFENLIIPEEKIKIEWDFATITYRINFGGDVREGGNITIFVSSDREDVNDREVYVTDSNGKEYKVIIPAGSSMGESVPIPISDFREDDAFIQGTEEIKLSIANIIGHSHKNYNSEERTFLIYDNESEVTMTVTSNIEEVSKDSSDLVYTVSLSENTKENLEVSLINGSTVFKGVILAGTNSIDIEIDKEFLKDLNVEETSFDISVSENNFENLVVPSKTNDIKIDLEPSEIEGSTGTFEGSGPWYGAPLANDEFNFAFKDIDYSNLDKLIDDKGQEIDFINLYPDNPLWNNEIRLNNSENATDDYRFSDKLLNLSLEDVFNLTKENNILEIYLDSEDVENRVGILKEQVSDHGIKTIGDYGWGDTRDLDEVTFNQNENWKVTQIEDNDGSFSHYEFSAKDKEGNEALVKIYLSGYTGGE